MKIIPGNYYTVIEGRFAGITGTAIDGDKLHSIDFGDDEVISFFGSLDHLREATPEEELAYRRRDD